MSRGRADLRQVRWDMARQELCPPKLRLPEAEALPSRRHPVHGVKQKSGQPTIIFVTVCTKDRKAWLATQEVHQLLHEIWKTATAWLVGRYVIMPDHIHLFAGPGEMTIPFDNWVRYWKSQFSRQHGNPSHRWETDHWDTRIRSAESYRDKWEYVRHNPVRHGLVTKVEDWPFQGSVYDLPW
jgi:putative transposase